MRENKRQSGWTVREVVNKNTGRRLNQYFFKRKRAPYLYLKTRLAKQLAGLTLIEKDLRSVENWLYQIEKMHNRTEGETPTYKISGDRETYNLIKGLYVSSLTFYGKCFTSCQGRRVKLDKKILGESFKPVHESVMHMRHNFAAHSGADNFEEVKISLVLYPKKKHENKPEIFRELMQPDFQDEKEEEKRFLTLVRHVRKKVLEKIDIVTEKIYQKEIDPKGIDYWYRKAKIK